jgi:hypothetical protein
LPEPPLDARHQAVVALVVVTEQMQQSVQGQHLQLGQLGMASIPRLAASDAAGDDDVAEWPGAGVRSRLESSTVRGKAENVSGGVSLPVVPVERADRSIAQESNRDRPPGAGGRDAAQPFREAPAAGNPGSIPRNLDAETPLTISHAAGRCRS